MFTLADLARHTVYLIVAGVFVLSVIAEWLFVHRRHPWLAVLAGQLIPLAFGAVVLAFVLPGPDDCVPPANCEWVGLGRALIMLAIAVMLAVNLVAAVVLNVVYPRVVWRGDPAASRRGPRAVDTLRMLAALLASTLLGLGAGMVLSYLVQSGLFVPWRCLGWPPQAPDARSQHEQMAPPQPVSGAAVLGSAQQPVSGAAVLRSAQQPVSGAAVLRSAQQPVSELFTRIFSASPEFARVETSSERAFQVSVSYCLSGRSGRLCWRQLPLQGNDVHVLYEPCAIRFLPPPLVGAVQRVSSRRCTIHWVSQSDYAVLADGSLWVWHYGVEPSQFPEYTWAVLFGMPGGFLAGLALVMWQERAALPVC